jgi:phage terminase large subunit GpA-like protein
VRVLVLEEVDGYGGSATAKGEGDQMGLAEKRTETYGYRRKIYKNSTPTVKGQSRIAREFRRSDQRYYHVPCPHCGFRQRLVWERLQYTNVEAPMYRCAGCEALIDEADKDAMVAAGEWVVTNPLREARGYHLNALYSPFVRWGRLVEEWEDAQGDPEKLQVFVNTALGEEWEDRETEDLKATLVARSRRYDGSDGDGPRAFDVPKMGCVLVAGVDKQAAELHVVVRAYGPGEQSWLIDWTIFRGDTSRPEVWAQLEEWRTTRRWVHEGGARLGLRAMCVDAGDDPDPVYAWTKPRLAQHVFAVKGSSDPTAPILPKKFTKTRQKSRLYVIGVQAIKKRLFRRAAMAAPTPCPLDVAPSFLHFNDRADATYWDEFLSQRAVWSNYRGKRVQRYELVAGKHDEKLDGEVYAYAALHLGPVRETELMAEWERVMQQGEAERSTAPAPTAQSAPTLPKPTSSWLGGRRRGGWL